MEEINRANELREKEEAQHRERFEKINEFSKVVFCDNIPEKMVYGVLYVSEKYET